MFTNIKNLKEEKQTLHNKHSFSAAKKKRQSNKKQIFIYIG